MRLQIACSAPSIVLSSFRNPNGRAWGTREVVVPNFPYVIIYTHDDTAVDIIAVFHGRQDRTP